MSCSCCRVWGGLVVTVWAWLRHRPGRGWVEASPKIGMLRQPVLVEQAMGVQALALLATLNAACDGLAQLAEAVTEQFRQHPDYAVITSFPGLGEITGARVLAELGDDRTRFADARALKAYAGSAPSPEPPGAATSST